MAKSPRMVPGAEARGLVAPRRTRPVLTASRPSQTMAQMGPEFMSGALSAWICFAFSCCSAGSWRGRQGLLESGVSVRTGDQTGEEGLASEISVVLLEVLLAGSAELDGSELEAAVLEAGDDGTNEATLGAESVRC